ncbi:ATP-binding protein [Candidatus Desulforudis audaxviator]|uniref:Cobyrinic acid a,c-diamide synthase n=1 Tax=Desulforudis audaxviator (strain MP104C) TaxID=477974 RepID=B1I1F0_DESAP|nr:AAA family ATPase [Candidatus Desulforudis audaxviator]ACA58675.1 Cobyrinic acid a,c-diamide synthase [Candidatus Desulforudis audaxviator MP104C]AZK58675.1 CO dehydrogenase accessory protein CooC (nickel insertion) [Candidatus Desulforudis audaxviator]
MKLAVSGKGGVGKTTIAAALVKSFARTHRLVYAIDGDPDACLAAAIGIPEEVAARLKPVAEMKELIRARSGSGPIYRLNPRVDDVVENYAHRLGNIRFLRLGEVKKGDSECYCRENTFLRALVSSLLLERGEVVIMDMGAGIEHLARGTAGGVDLMLVVVEPTRNSINTARHIWKMAEDLGIKKIRSIGNKIRSEKERKFIAGSFRNGELAGFVGYDESIWESAMMEEMTPQAGGRLQSEVEMLKKKILFL